MADSTKDDAKRRPAAIGGGVAVADDGDVAFGAMAGAGILAAIMVSFFVLTGAIGGATQSVVTAGTDTTEAAEASDADSLAISAALSAAGFPPVQLSHSGNKVTVRGIVADEATRESILDFVIDQPNVSEVVDELTIPEPEPEPSAAVASIEVTPDGIDLIGSVPSEEIASNIRDAAAASFEAEAITDELTVLEGATVFTITSSGFLQDPVAFKALNESLSAAIEGSGRDIDYTPGITLDAQVDASLNELVSLDPILFQSGTAVIDAASLPTIDRAAEVLKTFPDARIEIGGHTDNQGGPEFNQFLSLTRAEAVLAALVERGVETELIAVGYGPDQPVADNATPEGRALNRRIQFTALG